MTTHVFKDDSGCDPLPLHVPASCLSRPSAFSENVKCSEQIEHTRACMYVCLCLSVCLTVTCSERHFWSNWTKSTTTSELRNISTKYYVKKHKDSNSKILCIYKHIIHVDFSKHCPTVHIIWMLLHISCSINYESKWPIFYRIRFTINALTL